MGLGWEDDSAQSASGTSLVPVAPDTSTDVQGGYEFLSVRQGDDAIVANRGALVANFGLPVGGEFVLTRSVKQTGDVALLAGEFISPNGASWTMPPHGHIITGNVSGGLFRGAQGLILWGPTVNNVHASGLDFDVSSPGGELITVRGCTLQSPAGQKATNVGGFLEISRCEQQAGKLDLGGPGELLAFAFIDTSAVTTSTPGSVGFSIASGTLVGSVRAKDYRAVTDDASQSGVDVSTGIVSIFSDPCITIRDCSVQGSGTLLKAGSLGLGDIRFLSRDNGAALRDSLILGDCHYSDLVTPANVSGPADTWIVVPHLSAGGQLHLTSESEWFDLIDTLDGSPLTGATPPTRWALRYFGGLSTSPELHWSVLQKSGTGGTPFIALRLEVNPVGDVFPVADPGTWVGVDSTEQPLERLSSPTQGVGDGALQEMKPHTLYRLALETLDGVASDSDLLTITIKVRGPT